MINDDWDFYNLIALDEANEELRNKMSGIGFQYSTEIAIKVCTTVASDARSMQAICKDNPDFPSAGTIDRWRVFHPAFARNFNAAKKVQCQLLIDQIIDLADDPANCVPEILNWAKTRIHTRQFLASKLLPKIYGDKNIETLSTDNDRIKQELNEVKERLDMDNRKDY